MRLAQLANDKAYGNADAEALKKASQVGVKFFGYSAVEIIMAHVLIW